jgi:NAD(P)-dependent dehydrogenase (short-subunit alcohol dehydrogenase family)
MMTGGLARNLQNSGITVNDVSPGFVKTSLNRDARGFLAWMIKLSARLFAASAAKGADTPLWLASAPEVSEVTGAYFEKRQQRDPKFRDAAATSELLGTLSKTVNPKDLGQCEQVSAAKPEASLYRRLDTAMR